MSFVLSERCQGKKHYVISVKVESPSGSSWKEIAKVFKRSHAFGYMDLLNQFS